VVEHLLCKCRTLSSNPNSTKKLKVKIIARRQWFMSVILAIQETEIWRFKAS
jgi:hypothetical protein